MRHDFSCLRGVAGRYSRWPVRDGAQLFPALPIFSAKLLSDRKIHVDVLPWLEPQWSDRDLGAVGTRSHRCDH